jgi:hypothetical protein
VVVRERSSSVQKERIDMDPRLTLAPAILPGSPPEPCPELLTEEEAIRYLRLEEDRNPARSLRYYRERGLLRGTLVGRHLLYRRIEIERFLEAQTTGNRQEGRK